MIDAISKLVESGAISEEVQKSITDAWDSKVKENKEVVGDIKFGAEAEFMSRVGGRPFRTGE